MPQVCRLSHITLLLKQLETIRHKCHSFDGHGPLVCSHRRAQSWRIPRIVSPPTWFRNHFRVSHKFIPHRVTTNVIGIPGGFCRRYGTRELAIAAYNAALDGGEVTEVTVSKRVLSRNT